MRLRGQLFAVAPLLRAVVLLASMLYLAPEARPAAWPDRTTAVSAPQHFGEDTAFGFLLGEERRYVLGPPEALRGNEAAEWRITLVRILPEPGNWQAVFELSYERQERVDQLLATRRVEARLVVNESGFPLGIEFIEDVGGDRIVGEYAFEDGKYHEHVRFRSLEHDVPLPNLPHSCGDVSDAGGGVAFSAFRSSYGRNDYARNVWSNPGLLSLALPYPLPEQSDWERETLFLSLIPHTRFDYELGRRSGNRNACGRLALGRPERIDIGNRTVDARRLDVHGPFRGAWINAEGVILLLEYEPHDLSRPQHVRLLWPSEYD